MEGDFISVRDKTLQALWATNEMGKVELQRDKKK